MPQRAYNMAVRDPTTASWRGQYYSGNEALRQKLPFMRARSRELWENNDYAKAFGRQLKANVYGPKGIIHQSKIRGTRGRLNKTLNAQLELAYRIQSDKQNWSSDKRHTRRSFGRRLIEAVARDGGVLIKNHINFGNNSTGFAQSLLECDYLVDDYYATLANGNIVSGGVEENEFGEPVAYWLYTTHPGSVYGRQASLGQMTRVPASQVQYVYMAEDERPEQSVGVPWVHTAARRLRQVGEYEQAQLVAAVVGSRKMGFLTPSMEAAGLYSTGQRDEDGGDLVSEVEAGTIEELPPGYEFSTFDPTFPHQELPHFIKAMLRGTAAGLGPSYASLSNDLESVNYSSARIGLLSERDCWRMIQDFVIEDTERTSFERWLRYKILDGSLSIPIDRVPEIMAQQHFQPRGWEYTDPAKEVKASIDRINAGLSTPSIELAKLGLDIEDIYMMLEQDRALAEEHGLLDFLSVFSAPQQETMTTSTEGAPVDEQET